MSTENADNTVNLVILFALFSVAFLFVCLFVSLIVCLDLPIPLAGSLVKSPVFTGSAGHAWLNLDEKCHIYYEISKFSIARGLYDE